MKPSSDELRIIPNLIPPLKKNKKNLDKVTSKCDINIVKVIGKGIDEVFRLEALYTFRKILNISLS